MEINQIHQKFLECAAVSTDTRKITSQVMFFAIKGERFDANTFAKEALEKGASYVIIDNEKYFVDERTILVKDSLTALQELATFHRNYLKLPIIALTGSNGKTTTKELINVVLQKKYNVKATVGNLNNHIGVPLTLLSFNEETEIGIVEMGANHQKEIQFLCELAQPDFGYITNFGKAHLEGFGGTEGVIKGKSEMYDYLRKHDKFAFVNLDDAIQVEKTKDNLRITFSLTNDEASVKIKSVEANPFVKITFDGQVVNSNLIGIYNANNINVAVTIGRYFKIADEQIKEALETYVPDNNRSQLLHKKTNEIILDAYNANPSSMEVAIKNFLELDKTNKIAVLGDMFELGTESLAEHKNIVDLLKNQSDVQTYFVGKDFYANKIQTDFMHFFETFETFAEAFAQTKAQHKTMLIKGSRGMALERVLELV
ncbi:UDP-N-acetylmuramoyl-tripeptide--D-alanyl-D-alanine ligase [Flavobacterium sp. NST-5]|uniref:UDP-N-acetylmuramoyl-tripeptide--D-alanyl-D-alanine ligase n=1 Tax=Flavobacterium ichthyis TaxID=2698827 RepID=A0ABW9Z4K5_9FLAO|nr:UDP-N-acetylmuramoyl-tripeptide--D-alanyl-D-alanine ligase [Flavobacterium ichthyis]NBL63631.1 UDP-N-acetylmuramoyl-tripeptide--D-alanyl-D-alanine ligase [Flavobacterium ichthyis]